MGQRSLHVHIGASKTGTSALQRGLFGSTEQLREQGIGLPLASRHEHVTHLLRPLGWATAEGFVGPVEPRRLGRLARRLGRAGGDRVLLTCEDLCEADEDRIRALHDAFGSAGLEPHVVLTLRGLASTVPSEWQQFLKHRITLDYPTFLERVRDREGRWARHFWTRQDAVAICERWSAVVGADRLEVIITPPRSRDPLGLYRMFGEVAGFDPDRLTWPGRDVNASWGIVEAEVYRRLNLALGNRLSHYERGYQPAIRWPLVKGALPRGASERILLPPEHLPWVVETAEAQARWLRASSIRVHGDPADLVPDEGATAPVPEVDETAVAAAAVATMANLAVAAHRRQRRRVGA